VNQAVNESTVPRHDAIPESDIYLHDEQEIAFFLWDVLDIGKTVLDQPPFDKLTRQRISEIFNNAKAHANRLAESYSDADGDCAYRMDNGDVAIPEVYHELWDEHLRNWFWVRNQGDSVLLGAEQREHLPHVVVQHLTEMFVGSNPSFMTYAGFTPSALNLIKVQGTEKQKQVFVDKLASVEWDACLCTTEPQAGSDLSAIATNASRIDGEVFSVVGEKRYITAGMHSLTKNTVYLVLGRVKGAKPSSLSMSAFLIPRYWVEEDGSLSDNNVKCARVEHKMGLSGCANTHLKFGDGGVTRGYLLGNRANVGLLQLQMLMRKARIGTGQLALAMASSAYLHSLRYARQRVQGPRFDQSSTPSAPRVSIIEHLDVQRMLLEMRAKVEGCRALLAKISMHGTCLQQLTSRGISRDEPQAKRHGGLALTFAPIAKAYVSDEAWNIATLAIQVHGALGYLKDLPLEQYARDIKILTIWEGTNYIQSQDLVRDKLGFGRQSLALQHFEEDLRGFLAGVDAHPELAAEYGRLTQALDSVLATMKWVTEQADAGQLLKISQFCTRVLQMFGDLMAAWGLLEAAAAANRLLKAGGADEAKRAFYSGKIKTMRFFVYNILPRLFSNHEVILNADQSYMQLDDAEFGYPGGAGMMV
jgi:acyl-CoA dehydrogenase